MKKQLAAAAVVTTALLGASSVDAADTANTVRPVLNITLNAANADGKIRNILGINNPCKLVSKWGVDGERKLLKKLNPATVRWHDAAGNNSGHALIDVSRIFPLFHADENDPRNYNFHATDYYMSLVMDMGAVVEFRFGEQIDHSAVRDRIQCPTDMEKWARICVNIIRHYNEGWANGKHWNITDWSVWEEPNNLSLFRGSGKNYWESYPEYFKLYATVAKMIRKEFPNLKIGGPNAIPAVALTDDFFPQDNPQTSFCEKFLKYCKENDLPLDFFQVTHYCREPQSICTLVQKMRELTDKYGYTKTTLRIAEWNMYPQAQYFPHEDAMNSTFNAAFATASLIRLLDTPIEYASFYAWALGSKYTLFDRNYDPSPVYYGLCFFTEMSRCAKQIKPELAGSRPDGLELLSGVTADGKVKLLVSSYQSQPVELKIAVPGSKACKARYLTDESGKYESQMTVYPDKNGVFAYTPGNAKHSVALLEFSK